MSATRRARPVVSVVVPTCERPLLLQRAVESALAQRGVDFEVIVSDDERRAGASWAWLSVLAARDDRVVLTRNPGEPGQCANMNHALSCARGEWVKPLYDDDRLRPGCLHSMLRCARLHESAVLTLCLARRHCDGRPSRCERAGKRPPAQRTGGRDALLAMYIQDLDMGTPTQMLVRREAVERGVLFEAPLGLHSAVDTWWAARLLTHGDLVLVNEPLVDLHQGEHATVTSGMTDEALYAEFRRLRELLLPLLDHAEEAPPIQVVNRMLALLKAGRTFLRRSPLEGIAQAALVPDPRAWAMFARWALRRLMPGRFEVVPRLVLTT